MTQRTTDLMLSATLLAVGWLAGSCGNLFAAPPAVSVQVVHPLEQATFHHDFPATLEPAQQASLRAAAAGTVSKVLTQPGAQVKAGDVLVELGADTLQKQLQAAKVEQTHCEQQLAASTTAGADALDAPQLKAKQEVLAARFKLAKTRVEQLERELADLSVRAPFAGFVVELNVQNGDLVRNTAPLVVVVQTDPIHATFAMDEACVVLLGKLIQAKALKVASLTELSVAVGMPDEDGYPHAGKLAFIDNQVDPQRHQFTARAALPNAAGKLTSFALAPVDKRLKVRLRLSVPASTPQLVIPLKAVSTAADGSAQVLVVNEQQVAVARPVKLGQPVGELQIIKAGLQPTDWVIVSAEPLPANADPNTLSPTDFTTDSQRLRIQPGMVVAPQQMNFNADGTRTAPAAGDASQ